MNDEFDKTIYIPFLALVWDTSDVHNIEQQTESIKRFLFKGKEGTIVEKAGPVLSGTMAKILKEFEERGLEPKDDDRQQRFLESILEFLKSIPRVKITLAFEPSITFIRRLNDEISKEVGQKVILDIIINQFIVAGATFEYNGKIRDLSLAQKIDDFIADAAMSVTTP